MGVAGKQRKGAICPSDSFGIGLGCRVPGKLLAAFLLSLISSKVLLLIIAMLLQVLFAAMCPNHYVTRSLAAHTVYSADSRLRALNKQGHFFEQGSEVVLTSP